MRYKKIIFIAPLCLGFLCAIFFYPLIVGVSAAGPNLEVQYPVIAGRTLTSNTPLPEYVKYLFDAGVFIGFFAVFISLIISGVMYLLSPAKPELLADAKDRISGAISGLLILVTTYLIITTVNPQLSIFNLNGLPQTPQPPPPETRASGVYFYDEDNCPNNSRTQPEAFSISDLKDLKNNVNSVGAVQGSTTQTYYIPILYENINFWGKCQYINPNSSCTNVSPFANSASIHVYDFTPEGDVYFYRNSYFDDKGGYYKVSRSQIKDAGIYVEKLENLKFENVPLEEQDCIKYDKDGSCINRTPPPLSGKNISSIKISQGNYIVLLVSFDYENDTEEIWSSCQEFPTFDDTNKMGPQQVKWQNIMNNGGVIPNYVIIIPIKNYSLR